MNKRILHLIITFSLVSCVLTTARAQPELDITFNGTGKVTTEIGGAFSGAEEVLVQPDQKIIAVGNANLGGEIHFALTRFNADGSIDTSFGGNGFVISDLDPGPGTEEVLAAALQPDGKILAAGFVSAFNPGPGHFAVARYNPDGSLDTSFGDGGLVKTALFQTIHRARGVAVGQDGKIVVVGEYLSLSSQTTQSLIVRYNPDGSLDSSFGSGGMVTDWRGGAPSDANIPTTVAIQPDGKIVTAGVFSQHPTVTEGDVTVVRYNVNGSYDATFADMGRQLIQSASVNEVISAIALQPDGKIVAAGESGSNYLVMRFNADGSPDVTFDADGRVTTPIAGASKANSVIVMPSGKIFVSGLSFTAAQGMTAAFYNPDGSLDTSFSGDGKFTVGFEGSFATAAFGMAVDGLGRIVLGGRAYESDFALVRLYTPEPFPVTVGGQARTPDGTPIRGTRIGLTNQSGQTRWTISSNFGFFNFADVPTGQTYSLFVRGSKTHIFEGMNVGLNDAVENLDLIGDPREARSFSNRVKAQE